MPGGDVVTWTVFVATVLVLVAAFVAGVLLALLAPCTDDEERET